MQVNKKTEYTVKTNYDITYEKLSDITNTDNFIGGSDLYAIELKINEEKSGFYTNKSKNIERTVLTKNYLDKLIENPQAYELLKHQYHQESPAPIWLVKQEFISTFSQYGVYDNISRMEEKPKLDMEKLSSKNFIKDGQNPAYQFIQFIPNEEHLKVIQDAKGQKYLEPFIFDYIGGKLNNEVYHLDQLVEYLIKRDDISFIIDGEYYSHAQKMLHAPLKGNETGIDRIISNIPGYNAEPGCDEFINIVYRPKAEDVQKILDWKVDNPENQERKIWDLKQFIVQDVLGCEKFMVQPPQPEPEVPKRKFKR